MSRPNAHLTAAAPELLEACRAVISWTRTTTKDAHYHEVGRKDMTRLAAAIARAEGREVSDD